MALRAYYMHFLYAFLAVVFAYMTLAGYLIVPNLLVKLHNAQSVPSPLYSMLETTAKMPAIPYSIGTSCSLVLWWVHRENPIWLSAHIFL